MSNVAFRELAELPVRPEIISLAGSPLSDGQTGNNPKSRVADQLPSDEAIPGL